MVDAASLAVHRRYRRAKPDKLDVQTLLTMLVRCVLGERRRWKGGHVPSAEPEPRRQPQRALRARQEARTPHRHRRQGRRAGLGLEAGIDRPFPARLPALRPWEGGPVPARLPARLLRAGARGPFVQRPRQARANAEARRVRDDQRGHVAQVRTRMRRRGMGAHGLRVAGAAAPPRPRSARRVAPAALARGALAARARPPAGGQSTPPLAEGRVGLGERQNRFPTCPTSWGERSRRCCPSWGRGHGAQGGARHHVTPGNRQRARGPLAPTLARSPRLRRHPPRRQGGDSPPDGAQGGEGGHNVPAPAPAALATRQVLPKRPPWGSLRRA
jgi:hypothetical protein